MLAAGALCGACVGWTYGLMAAAFSVAGWVRYNLIYVGMFGLLGGISVIVFEPITTAAAVIAADKPPDELFARAFPLSAVFTVVMAMLISIRYGRRWTYYVAVLLTCSVLVLLLGFNVAIIGLVDVPNSAAYLIAELFGLIVALGVAFAAAVTVFPNRPTRRRDAVRRRAARAARCALRRG